MISIRHLRRLRDPVDISLQNSEVIIGFGIDVEIDSDDVIAVILEACLWPLKAAPAAVARAEENDRPDVHL